jgi:hypothetical protein
MKLESRFERSALETTRLRPQVRMALLTALLPHWVRIPLQSGPIASYPLLELIALKAPLLPVDPVWRSIS